MSGSLGDLEPLSADWAAFRICSEIWGCLAPRPSLVRTLAALTASTQGFSAAFASTCLACTAAVGATYDSAVSV